MHLQPLTLEELAQFIVQFTKAVAPQSSEQTRQRWAAGITLGHLGTVPLTVDAIKQHLMARITSFWIHMAALGTNYPQFDWARTYGPQLSGSAAGPRARFKTLPAGNQILVDFGNHITSETAQRNMAATIRGTMQGEHMGRAEENGPQRARIADAGAAPY